MEVTSLSPPAAMTSRRAGGEGLLGRLEQQPYPAGQLAAGGQLGQRPAGTEQQVVCTSWPQAWQAPATVER